MKILVTGSSGTIGTRLCEKLIDAGHSVKGADREPNKWKSEVDNITINVDLRDQKKLHALPTDVDMIVHLAANARVYELVEHPDRAMDNFTTTFNVLEFARGNGIRKFIFASSREVYGNVRKKGGQDPFSEEDADFANCESPYTASKIGGEALMEAYKRCYGIDAIIFRFSNVYGMYDDSVRVVPLFLREALAGRTMTVFGRDKCLDFTYIDDCVKGIMLGIEKFATAKNDTYNLATGEGTTILHLAERMKELLKSDSRIEIAESRTGEVTHYIADISKARNVLEYEPRILFDEGIEKAVRWYRENGT